MTLFTFFYKKLSRRKFLIKYISYFLAHQLLIHTRSVLMLRRQLQSTSCISHGRTSYSVPVLSSMWRDITSRWKLARGKKTKQKWTFVCIRIWRWIVNELEITLKSCWSPFSILYVLWIFEWSKSLFTFQTQDTNMKFIIKIPLDNIFVFTENHLFFSMS